MENGEGGLRFVENVEEVLGFFIEEEIYTQ